MAPQIKYTSPEHCFDGKFVETTLFDNGNFIISYDGVGLADENVGKLHEGVSASEVYRVRMAEHIAPPGIECGPIAVFVLWTGRILVYEFWTSPKMNHTTGTNGFWISTSLKVENIARFHPTLLPIKVITAINEEKSSDTIKVIKHTLFNGLFESYDL
jgi:hypothetical protein